MLTVAKLREIISKYSDDTPVAVELPVSEWSADPAEKAEVVCAFGMGSTEGLVLVLGVGPTQFDELRCTECDEPMFVTGEGVSHHVDLMSPDGIDHDLDAEHVAIAPED